jgi:hypothetical protein
MNITLVIIVIILFAVVYFAKRRFGMLALAMVAGSIISASWSGYVTIVLQLQGVRLISPPLNVVVAGMLIVLPAAFLLFVGPTYRKKWQRIVGSLLLSIFGIVLITAAIQREAPTLLLGNQVITNALQFYPVVLVVGVILAIADTVHAHLPRKNRKHID